jgi:hypothetical protein
MQKRSAYLITFLFFALLLAGCANSNNKNTQSEQSDNSSCDNNERTIAFEKPTTEILTAEIDTDGGVLQAKDDNGQWVAINIPPGSVEQKTKISLDFKKSTYEVKSGVKSPLSFTISPDISFNQPVRATIVYDKKYSCENISVVVPYLIDNDNTLSAAQLIGLYKNQNIFTMDTFHGGTYSWVYVE